MNRGIRVLQTHALPLGYVTILKKRRLLHSKISVLSHVGAEDEARTRYLHLGKVALYQMSYGRILQFLYPETAKQVVPPIGIEPMTRGFSVPCSTN